jgi:hypothetical protein
MTTEAQRTEEQNHREKKNDELIKGYRERWRQGDCEQIVRDLPTLYREANRCQAQLDQARHQVQMLERDVHSLNWLITEGLGLHAEKLREAALTEDEG